MGRQLAGWIVLAVGSLLPLALLLHEVLHNAVSTPFDDEWELVPLLQRSAHGTLGLGNLWAQHNEHRPLFPNIALLGLARTTHWSIRIGLLANVAVAAVIAGILLALAQASLKRFGPLPVAVMGIAAAWYTFAPTQWENWMWGWQLGWFFAGAGVVGAIALLAYPPRRLPELVAFVLAVSAAVLASYSLANGLSIWFPGLVVLVARRSRRSLIVAWLGAAVVTVSIFFIGYRSNTRLFQALEHPGALSHYMLVLLGTPVAGPSRFATEIGLLLVALCVASVAWLSTRDPEAMRAAACWVALALFSALSAFLTGVGRSNFGIMQAASSRYITLSTFFFIGTLGVFLSAAGSTFGSPPRRIPRLVVHGAVAALLIWALAAARSPGLAGFQYRRLALMAGGRCLVTAISPDEPCLTQVYPSGIVVWPWLQYVRAHHLAGYRPPPSPSPSAPPKTSALSSIKS